ncbi:glutamine amidotransferase-related protein [Nocardiopsis metallicus]|uniref:Putative glutamine amidotransferase n=1 Tax=Nocardiopsis metallicus TaxID=179819 RepID=A0A840WTE0_9ACTN|nr:gamma-glutamyl-gamma-aminobutyrate hydrolase family protein [Nocardiopsis metallicus]MBB5494827.1 putative glutamine amidotransferase [Nocardiopsis metallicus]
MITGTESGWVAVTQRRVHFDHRGEEGDYLDARWMAHLTDSRLLLVPNNLPAARHMLANVPLTAIILSGGNDLPGASHRTDLAPERDAVEDWLLGMAEQQLVPVIGICHGAQVIAVRHGACLAEGSSQHAGTRHLVRTVAQTPWGWPPTFTVTSHHRDVLSAQSFPDDLQVLALAEDSTVEAYAHRHLPWWGLMWHPEREQPPATGAHALHHLLHTLTP